MVVFDMEIKDLYWLSGLLEGEGHFGLRRQGRDLVIQVGMTDLDVIDRAHRLIGSGSRKSRVLPSGKTFHIVTVANQSVARDLMEKMLPIMGERRAQKMRECLAAHAEVDPPKRDWTHCKNGHELSGANLRVITEGKYTKRRCVECSKLRQRKHRASKFEAAGIFAL
jgi:hypothetical protein